MEDYRVSKWAFDTSAGAGVGLGFAAMSGGLVSLLDPQKRAHHFHYGGFGVGGSAGFSLTKIKVPETLVQNYIPTGGGSLANFPSYGGIYITSAFRGGKSWLGRIYAVSRHILRSVAALL